jgi:hypothetical protein
MDLSRILNWLRRRQSAYRSVFSGPAGDIVLADLAVFCRATEPTFHADARLHALAEGRREVFLRIQKQLHLSDEQLLELVTQGKSPKE